VILALLVVSLVVGGVAKLIIAMTVESFSDPSGPCDRSSRRQTISLDEIENALFRT
jgi:hypothetical protein